MKEYNEMIDFKNETFDYFIESELTIAKESKTYFNILINETLKEIDKDNRCFTFE